MNVARAVQIKWLNTATRLKELYAAVARFKTLWDNLKSSATFYIELPL